MGCTDPPPILMHPISDLEFTKNEVHESSMSLVLRRRLAAERCSPPQHTIRKLWRRTEKGEQVCRLFPRKKKKQQQEKPGGVKTTRVRWVVIRSMHVAMP